MEMGYLMLNYDVKSVRCSDISSTLLMDFVYQANTSVQTGRFLSTSFKCYPVVTYRTTRFPTKNVWIRSVNQGRIFLLGNPDSVFKAMSAFADTAGSSLLSTRHSACISKERHSC